MPNELGFETPEDRQRQKEADERAASDRRIAAHAHMDQLTPRVKHIVEKYFEGLDRVRRSNLPLLESIPAHFHGLNPDNCWVAGGGMEICVELGADGSYTTHVTIKGHLPRPGRDKNDQRLADLLGEAIGGSVLVNGKLLYQPIVAPVGIPRLPLGWMAGE